MRKSDQIIAMTQAMKTSHDRPVNKADVSAFLTAYSKLIQEELEANGEFILHGVGKLSLSQRSERRGRNPHTGEPMTIPPKTGIKFAATKAFKDSLNSK